MQTHEGRHLDEGRDQQTTYEQLNQIFAEQNKEQLVVREARDILGESGERLTDEQVYNLTSEIQYLVDSWLEEFERNAFDGKTLEELLHL